MRVAMLQMNAGIDPAVNALTLVQAIRDAGAAGCDMLFTPEMSNLLDSDRARSEPHLRPEPEDETLAVVQAAAREAGLWVHLGSLALRGENGKRLNRAIVIDFGGEVRARYDKLHLFDVDLATGERWRESAVYARGERAVAADTPWARLGLSICYDMRFPDLFRALTGAGASILAIPAAFTVPTGRAHWHVLLRARAIEAGVFVVAAAQTGRHEDGRETFGHSLLVDPWGEVLLDMGTEPGLGIVDIDLAQVDAIRARVPALHHRREIPTVEIVG
jgi:predicted amidohydrolase